MISVSLCITSSTGSATILEVVSVVLPLFEVSLLVLVLFSVVLPEVEVLSSVVLFSVELLSLTEVTCVKAPLVMSVGSEPFSSVVSEVFSVVVLSFPSVVPSVVVSSVSGVSIVLAVTLT